MDQSLDLFVSDYRKNLMYNWNPPVRDQLQAVSTDDVDDLSELEEFNLVNSLDIDNNNTNHTDYDHNSNSVDVTIQSVGTISPANGNIGMVISNPPLDVNTQSLNRGLARIPIHDENKSQHDNTNSNSNNVLDLHTVDVTGQCGSPVIPADGNVSTVFPDSPLSDVNTQTTSSPTLLNNNNNTTLNRTSVDQVIGNRGVILPAHVPKGIAKIVELTLELFDRNYNLYAQRINHHDDGLFIRAVLMKDNIIYF